MLAFWSKNVTIKLSTLIVFFFFFDSTFVLVKYRGIFKNLNLYPKFKRSNGKVSNSCEDKIMKHLKILQVMHYIISSKKHCVNMDKNEVFN